MKIKHQFAVVVFTLLSVCLWAQDGTFTTESGVKVTTVKQGSGPTVAQGQEIEMHFVSKDPQGKVIFDSRALGVVIHDVVVEEKDDKVAKAMYEVITNCQQGDVVKASVPKTLLDANDPAQKISGDYVTMEIEVISISDPKPNAADLIESTITAAGVDAGKAVFDGLQVKNPEDYKFHQWDFNVLGYEFLEKKNTEASIEVFKMNTTLFPDSANTYDSLGDAYVAAGDKEEAIVCFEMALKLNPDFEASQKKLDELKKN